MADSLENESAAALLSMKEGGRTDMTGSSAFRRENPPRIRKRNRLIFNDDEDTSYSLCRSSPRKHARVSSTSVSHRRILHVENQARPNTPALPVLYYKIPSPPSPPPLPPLPPLPDRKAALQVGGRLKNVLKLPKAHKWVCYEWFYSNIDQPLFLGDNDFCACLRESFPQLKTLKLSRPVWVRIRRLMGKPRRCSPAFLSEEIASLHSKRQRIRQLQQRKAVDLANFRDLPEEIPLPLVIGTKVTARLRKPQDGLFMGSIDAVDTSNATYRITFDRQGLASHSVPDYEVLSNEPQDMMPISAFARKHRPRSTFFTPPRYNTNSPSPQLENDPLLSGSPLRPGFPVMEEGTLGGFPVKFLVLLVRLSKILAVKKEKISELKKMNTEAEKMRSHQFTIPLDFQKKYAAIILEFEKLNHDLNEYLLGVQQYCHEIAPEQGLQPVTQPEMVRQQCLSQAKDMVKQANGLHGLPLTENDRIVDLISNLTSIMLQVKCLAENDLNSFEFKSLSDSLAEIQSNLEPQNVTVFQNQVEIHIKHIEAGLSQLGNLHAFATQHVPV